MISTTSRSQHLNPTLLRRQNRLPHRCGRCSSENRNSGFRPAFHDLATGISYLSRYADGSPAPFHLLDGLPQRLLERTGKQQRLTATTPSLIAGFLRADRFYTREQAAIQQAEIQPPSRKTARRGRGTNIGTPTSFLHRIIYLSFNITVLRNI